MKTPLEMVVDDLTTKQIVDRFSPELLEGINIEERKAKARNELKRLPYHEIEVSLADLKVDSSYHDELDPSRVLRIVQNFHLGAVNPILVSRRKDGSLYTMDGRHTSAALMILGIPKYVVRVYDGLSIEQEASIYLIRSDQKTHKRISGKAQHNALVAKGDAKAKGLQNVLDKAGFTINPSRRKGITVTGLVEFQKSYAVDNGRSLEPALFSARAAWPNAEIPGIHVRALTAIFHKGGIVDSKRLERIIRQYTPAEWTERYLASTAGKKPTTKYMPYEIARAFVVGIHTRTVKVNAYNDGARKNTRLDWEIICESLPCPYKRSRRKAKAKRGGKVLIPYK